VNLKSVLCVCFLLFIGLMVSLFAANSATGVVYDYSGGVGEGGVLLKIGKTLQSFIWTKHETSFTGFTDQVSDHVNLMEYSPGAIWKIVYEDYTKIYPDEVGKDDEPPVITEITFTGKYDTGIALSDKTVREFIQYIEDGKFGQGLSYTTNVVKGWLGIDRERLTNLQRVFQSSDLEHPRTCGYVNDRTVRFLIGASISKMSEECVLFTTQKINDSWMISRITDSIVSFDQGCSCTDYEEELEKVKKANMKSPIDCIKSLNNP
jgi:hypothetical protein